MKDSLFCIEASEKVTLLTRNESVFFVVFVFVFLQMFVVLLLHSFDFNICSLLTLSERAELFQRFHNPQNSNMDYTIFNAHIRDPFACIYPKGTLVYSLSQRTSAQTTMK